MHLKIENAFEVILEKHIVEKWINRDARENEVIAENETVKINKIEEVNGNMIATMDLFEEYMN